MFDFNGINVYATMLNQFNKDSYFPAFDFGLTDFPVMYLGQTIDFSPRLMVWAQPEGFQFSTSDTSYGGLVSVKASIPIGNIDLATTLETKTKGWVAGIPYLERYTGLRTEFAYRF